MTLTDLSTALFIAYKSIMRSSRSLLAFMLLILCLSFFNMVFIPGVFSGLLDTITNLLINTTTSDIVITPQQLPVPEQFIADEEQLQAQLHTIPGIVGTARVYLTAGSISFDADKNGVFKSVSAQMIGIDPGQVDDALSLKRYLVAGQFLSPSDTDQVLLPAALAGGYGLPVPSDLGGAKVGDKVTITYANGVRRQYTVKGIVNITFGTALSNTYITSREAESVLGASDQASQILVKVDASHPLSYYKGRIEALAPQLQVKMYSELLAVIQSVLDAFTLIAGIVSIISVLVAAITIFVMIYINALNRRRQIGILKAIGIKEDVVVWAYVFQSLFYVICGVLVGLFFVFGILLPVLSVHPIMLPFGPLLLSFGPTLIGESVIGFLVAGFISGLVPARLVVRESILTAIWG